MKILYSAIDQAVPAAHGGSVHVTAVAEGLAALGHQVQVLVSPGDAGAMPKGHATWIDLHPPLGNRRLRLLRTRDVVARAKAFRPDVVMERYYNFGGEAVLAGVQTGALVVLEVNAPVVDQPGSAKRLIDRALILQPMRRWRDWLCRHADLIVTPSARILPADVPREKIHLTEWGADTAQFRPDSRGLTPAISTGGLTPAITTGSDPNTVAVFAGAFRAWHGAIHLVDAIRRLRERGRKDIKGLMIGDGPEWPRVSEAAAGVDGITLTGAMPHAQIPAMLASADIGVAPFDIGAHPTLAHEFHWSPLKVFEYMASGLPVVAPRIPRLATIVEDGKEGILYDGADAGALAEALERASVPEVRRALGAAARARAVREFSWDAHCRRLDEAIRAAHARLRCAS